MSDQIPNAEEQIPSVEDIFQNLEGHPADEQVPVLAAIVQALVGQLADVDARLSELDQKFHGEIYGPLKDSYQSKIRGQGLQSMKQKYGSLFDPILEPLKGFGIDDPYSTLYDMLEGMKKDGSYKEEDEATYIGDQHKEAMKRIGAIRGTPPAEEAAKEEKAAEAAPEPEKPEEAAVEVEVKKEPASKPKSLREKKMSMMAGY